MARQMKVKHPVARRRQGDFVLHVPMCDRLAAKVTTVFAGPELSIDEHRASSG